MNSRLIIHVDMDAFFASVEMRDNPSLKDKPLIIGSLPNERGVVSTCNYRAREYGIHSAMNIKEAYKLCPNAIFMHPNFEKYKEVSNQIHKIWNLYATQSEAVALDEAYLDITNNVKNLKEAREVAKIIKQRIKNELGLTCSVGLAYCKIAAKTASEEMKPNGYFEILTRKDFVDLVSNRDVNSLYTVGQKTTKRLNANGIYKVKDIQNNKDKMIRLFGKRGLFIYNLSYGIDDRELKDYKPENAQSISREVTFQKDVEDYDFLKDVLFILALCVEYQTKRYGLHGNGVQIKVTYSDMKTITRSRIVNSCDYAIEIQKEAIRLFNQIEMKTIRLIGVGVYNLNTNNIKQLSLDDLIFEKESIEDSTKNEFILLNKKYNLDFEKNITKLYNTQILFKTIEYMRKYSSK